ncbi:MAG: hypothetical protein Q4Q03_02620, partial [Bowdeniella nasicola]|nr:hypothetical protein [Bowdeniella nasicola]
MTRVFLTVCAIVLALSACTPGESGPAGPTTGSGYQGGDGSYTVWAQGERGEPIRVQGSDLAGEAIDSSAWR